MLIDLDHTTLTYMAAALEGVCNKIPPEKDSSELRKRIGNAMIASAETNQRAFADFEEAGMKVLNEAVRPGHLKRPLQHFGHHDG
jgi:hypothetical protein